jgi:hypothetical protein
MRRRARRNPTVPTWALFLGGAAVVGAVGYAIYTKQQANSQLAGAANALAPSTTTSTTSSSTTTTPTDTSTTGG